MDGSKQNAARVQRADPVDHPLVPNAALRQMHAAMLDLRRGGRTAGGRRSGTTTSSRITGGNGRGREAMLASSLLSLRAGDLVSLQAGATLAPALDRMPGAAAGVRLLEALGAGADRVMGAMGAATALPALKAGAGGEEKKDGAGNGARSGEAVSGAGRGLVLIYGTPGEISGLAWERLLGMAGAAALPVIFAVLPGAEHGRREPRPGWLSARTQGWGVPGIPVDADDPVALFRVMQESVLRARAGDGPTLLEAVVWAPQGVGAAKRNDPVRAVEQVLRRRGQPVPGRGAAVARGAKRA